jgi:hypothetical protein
MPSSYRSPKKPPPERPRGLRVRRPSDPPPERVAAAPVASIEPLHRRRRYLVPIAAFASLAVAIYVYSDPGRMMARIEERASTERLAELMRDRDAWAEHQAALCQGNTSLRCSPPESDARLAGGLDELESRSLLDAMANGVHQWGAWAADRSRRESDQSLARTLSASAAWYDRPLVFLREDALVRAYRVVLTGEAVRSAERARRAPFLTSADRRALSRFFDDYAVLAFTRVADLLRGAMARATRARIDLFASRVRTWASRARRVPDSLEDVVSEERLREDAVGSSITMEVASYDEAIVRIESYGEAAIEIDLSDTIDEP